MVVHVDVESFVDLVWRASADKYTSTSFSVIATSFSAIATLFLANTASVLALATESIQEECQWDYIYYINNGIILRIVGLSL